MKKHCIIVIKILGAVSVCDSPAGHRPDDLCNRPRLCGKLPANDHDHDDDDDDEVDDDNVVLGYVVITTLHYRIVVNCFQLIMTMIMMKLIMK